MLSKKLNHSTFQKIDGILNNFQRLVPPLIILVFFLKNISSVVLLTIMFLIFWIWYYGQ